VQEKVLSFLTVLVLAAFPLWLLGGMPVTLGYSLGRVMGAVLGCILFAVVLTLVYMAAYWLLKRRRAPRISRTINILMVIAACLSLFAGLR